MFFPSLSPLLREFLAPLKGSRVAVLGHMRPDGDCIGSQAGLTECLRDLSIDAIAINQDNIPRTLETFARAVPFQQANTFNAEGYTAITVDCSDKKLIGKTLEGLFPQIALNIDHHLSNTHFAKLNIIDNTTAATGELLAGMLLDLQYTISPTTAQALYIGIATDTGQFRYPATSVRTFNICSQLIQRGANPAEASLHLYESVRLESIQLLQRFLTTLQLECDNTVCTGLITERMYRETNTSREDAEGFVDYARSIQGVEIAVLFEDTQNLIKVSLRSKDPKYRVDLLANQFQGGGHACAAGLRVKESIQEFRPKFMKALKDHLKLAENFNA